MNARLRIAPPPRLADAVDQPGAAAGTPQRLAYREREIPGLLGISLTHWQRSVHAGLAPPADIHLGRINLWSYDLLVRWVADCGRINGK